MPKRCFLQHWSEWKALRHRSSSIAQQASRFTELYACAAARLATALLAAALILSSTAEAQVQEPPEPIAADEAAAAINVAGLENAVIPITRPRPGGSGRFELGLDLAAAATNDIDRLGFAVAPALETESKEPAAGSIRLVEGASCAAPSESVPTEIDVSAGRATLCFAGFGRAGRFQTNLTFSSPRLEEPAVVPITIMVKDFWAWPFAVVFFGVLAGAGVHWMVRLWRPRQLMRYRLLQLRRRLEALEIGIDNIDTRRTYNGLLDGVAAQLARVEIEADVESAATNLEKEIAALESELATREAQALKRHAELEGRLDEAAARLDAIAGIDLEQHFAALRLDLKGAEHLLQRGHIEEGAEAVDAAETRFNRLRSRLIEEANRRLGEKIAKVPDANAKAEFRTRLQAEIARLQSDRNAEIGSALRTLADDVEAALPGATAARAMAVGKQPAPVTRIVVEPPAERRVSGELLTFRIDSPAKQIKGVVWRFGARGYSTNKLEAQHRFRSAGGYTVTAVITYEDDSSQTLSLPIHILPTRTERKLAGIRDAIRLADVGLLLIAVIVATLTAMLQLYVDKPFGTVGDYINAFLWGFGVEAATRGFSATFGRLSAPE